MGPGNKAKGSAGRASTGPPTVKRAVTPILLVLRQEGVKEDDRKLNDANRVKLWIINHIDDFCVNVFGRSEDWKHLVTDHEGVLAKRLAERPWSDIVDSSKGKYQDPDKEKYQVYFTTLPLVPPVDPVCNKLCSQGSGLEVKSQGNIPRPYPEDPFFMNLSPKDLPPQFSMELKNSGAEEIVSYEAGKHRLRSVPDMPERVRDRLVGLSGATPKFKDAIRTLHRESQKKAFPKIWLLEIPSSVFPQIMTSKKLLYWESVMFRDSTALELDEARSLMKRKQFKEDDFNKLRELLKDMRGNFVYYYRPDRTPSIPPADKLAMPWVVYDQRSTPAKVYSSAEKKYIKRLCGMDEPGILDGPLWAVSIWQTQAEDGLPIEGGADPKDPVIKGGVALFKMNPPYEFPTAHAFFPAVDDPLLDEIAFLSSSYLEELYKSLNENDLRLFIENVFYVKGKLDFGLSKFLSCFFYVGEAEEAHGAMMMALDAAIKHWQCRTETTMTDVSSFKADPIMKIEKNIIVGFGTGCDGYSESPNPKHVYAQLEDWYKNLDDTEKEEVKNSYEIEVKGYSSPYGERRGQVNVELRDNRAWKIAQSLKLVLSKEGMNIDLKPLQPKEDPPQGPPPDPKKKPASVPLYFKGESRVEYPTKNLSHLFAPLGSTLCEIIENTKEALTSVNGVPIDNDPKDRIGWVILRRSEERKHTQYVKEKGKYNAAGPLAGYRMVGHAKFEKDGKEIVRVLLYVIPAFWK